MNKVISPAMVGKRKILKFRRNQDALLASAERRLENGEALGALRILNTLNVDYAPTADSCAALADACEMLEVNTRALKAWYAFLDVCLGEDLGDAYEGIAVNYMNLGRETQAAYYYNLLMQVDQDISEESKMEIVETFSKPRKNPLKFVYPPVLADYSEELESGLKALKEGNYESARELFAKAPAGSQQYKAAQNLTAISYLLSDETKKAFDLCLRLIEEDENDVQAYTTYAAVLGQMERREEAVEVAKKLCKMQTEDTDERYKIATVCCENGLHEEALELFTGLEEEIPNDKTLLYFKAVSAYKSGKTELCLASFEKLLTVYPDAAVARYYYDAVRYYENNKENTDLRPPVLNYFYTVPQEVKDRYCELLYFLEKARMDAVAEIGMDKQVNYILDWCFDESEGFELNLQNIAIYVAVRCNCEDFLRRKLLDPDVADVLKVFALERIAERNRGGSYGVVICHIYRRVEFMRVKIGVKKHRRFIQAFASVYAKFAVISETHAKRICAATELLYNCLSVRELLSLADGTSETAAAIYLLSGIKEGGGNLRAACNLFNAKERETEFIVTSVQEVTEEIQRKNALEKRMRKGESLSE